MNVPTLNIDSVQAFISFSHDMSACAKKTAAAAENLKYTYHDLTSAFTNFPKTTDADNVVRLGLMENRLRRDIKTLRSEMHRLQKILIESTKCLIQSGNSALATSYTSIQATRENYAQFDRARSELIYNLYLLDNLDLTLHSINCEKI